MVLIGLVGSKGSGKDVFANFLVNNYGFIKYSFAEKLKNVCKELFNFTNEQLYGNKKEEIDKKWGYSPRTIFQKLGDDFIKKQLKLQNLWIYHFQKWYSENNFTENDNIVIADVRFLDESFVIKEKKGFLIRVNRINHIVNDNHISENENKMIDCDFEITSSLKLNDLISIYNCLNKYMNKYMNK